MTYIAPRPTTHQEVFDTVATHMLTQNAKSTDGWGCVYRNNDGLMCAAGCLLDDAEVTPDTNILEWVMVCPDRLDFSSALVVDLQAVHDNCDVTDWPEALRLVATEYNLSAAVVDR